MKHKKRLMLMLLAIAAVILCSCSNSKNDSETTEPAASGDSMNVVISYESDTEATTDTDTPEETNVIPWFQEILNKTYPTKEGADENSVSYFIKDGVAVSSNYNSASDTYYIRMQVGNMTDYYRLSQGKLSYDEVELSSFCQYFLYMEAVTGQTIKTVMIAPTDIKYLPIKMPNSVENFEEGMSYKGGLGDYKTIDGVWYSRDGKTLVAFPAGRTGEYTVPDGVEKIADNAFDYSRLTKVTLPSSVKDVGKAFEKAEHIKIVR